MRTQELAKIDIVLRNGWKITMIHTWKDYVNNKFWSITGTLKLSE